MPVATQVAIGVSVPLVVLAVCIAMGSFIRHHRRNRERNHATISDLPTETDQLYLQRKGELEATEQAKFELDGTPRQLELEGDNEIHEIPTSINNPVISRLQSHELRGEEHSKELRGEEQTRELE